MAEVDDTKNVVAQEPVEEVKQEKLEDGKKETREEVVEEKEVPLRGIKRGHDDGETIADGEKADEEGLKTKKVALSLEETAKPSEPESKEEIKETETKESDAKETLEKNEKAKAQDLKQPEKPKFVFGSSTPFGNGSGFALFANRKSVFDKPEQDKDDKDSTTSTSTSTTSPSVFGGGSAFGNAFQKAMSKKSIFENLEPKKDEDKVKEGEDGESSETQSKEATPSRDSVYQKVHLEKKTDITTGEEGEETVFAVKSKLYALDLTDVKEGWKEKGIGVLRLNKSKDSKYRLLMRADAILKVILNFPVHSKTEIFKGMESSLHGEKFLRFNFVEGEQKKPVQYALKFGHADSTTKLYELLNDIISSNA